MKKLKLFSCLFLLVSMSALLPSCSSEKSAGALLASVPAQASWVALADNPGDGSFANFSQAAAAMCGLSSLPADALDHSCAVAFGWKDLKVASFFVKDEGKLSDALAKTGVTLNDGVGAGGKVILRDGRLWIASSTLGVDNVKYFLGQKEENSYMSVPYAKTLLECDDPIAFILNYDRVLTDGGDLQRAMTIRMVAGSVFNDPKYLAGTASLKSGRVSVKAQVLDSRLKPASLSLSPATLDPAELDLLGAAPVYLGLALSEGDVARLAGQFASVIPGDLSENVKLWKGQVTAALPLGAEPSETELPEGAYVTLPCTSDPGARSLASALSSTGDVPFRVEGSRIFGGSPIASGIAPQGVRDAFKGAMFAFTAAPAPGAVPAVTVRGVRSADSLSILIDGTLSEISKFLSDNGQD